MKTLIIIPARGGSKGLPGKNIKLLNGKPLICYSIDVAKKIEIDSNICVSTENDEIISIVENYGLHVPFKRPAELATDNASTYDVLLHAISYYEAKNIFYDVIVLLQPTSPFRTEQHIKEAISLFNKDIDMVVSVQKSHAAASLCRENENGILDLIINKDNYRRQDLDSYYEYNGSIYVINVNSLKNNRIEAFTKKIKYVMPAIYSVDIDNQYDWDIAEFLMKKYHEQ